MRKLRKKTILFWLFTVVFWGLALLIMPALPIGLCNRAPHLASDCEIPIGALTLLITVVIYAAFAVWFWRSKLSGVD